MTSILFNEPRTHSIPYLVGEASTDPKKLSRYAYIELQPGLNLNFPEEILEKIKSHPDFKALHDLGIIKVVKDPVVAKQHVIGGVTAIAPDDGQPVPLGQAKIREPL